MVLAALHRAVDNESCRFDPQQLSLSLDQPNGAWLRMRRTHRSRAVLWGRSALAPDRHPDARRDAPDWALTDATEDRRPSFVAWYSHREWDVSTVALDEGALQLLRPLLTVDPKMVELARCGRLTAAELASFATFRPILERAPRGDGHPVLVLPGLGGDDRSTVPLRGFLRRRGYAVHGWGLGTNRISRSGAE